MTKTIKNNSSIKALYVHIPFCNHICAYCDFPKVEFFSLLADKYLIELSKELKELKIGEIDTIYVGGGTPTSLSDEQFELLLKTLSLYQKGVKEYTVESNVESLDINKLKLMKKYGVSRLSIGVESTDDTILESLNRHHTYSQTIKSISLARECGFNNINVDLILGLPNYSLEKTKEDLLNILKLSPEHISTYSLIIEPNTTFFNRGIESLSDVEEREYYDLVHNILSNEGYEHYEISNFARPGKKSKHNLTYWKNEEYYAVGVGASGYIEGIRYTNTKSITEYLKGKRRIYEEKISKIDDEEYYIMLNLRTSSGINQDDFLRKFGFSFYNKYKIKIDNFVRNKLLIVDKNNIVPTYEGMMLSDFIIRELLI
jgi:oxygen-independent coproporphyrinogen-3 oxidase